MLIDNSAKAIGKFALEDTNKELFGMGCPNLEEAKRTLLYSFALLNKHSLSEEVIANIEVQLTTIQLG